MNDLKCWCANLAICLLLASGAAASEEIFTQQDEPSRFCEGAWTVVVLPDTQHYVSTKNMAVERKHPILDSMMDWIADEHEKRNIQVVVHVGDITNTTEQWSLIRSSYRKLDPFVPYLLCVGNHDESRKKRKQALINDYFRVEDNTHIQGVFGATYEPGKLQNAYYIITANGLDYLFLALEHEPRKEVVQWANMVIRSHAGHRVFLTVHQLLCEKRRLLSDDGLPGYDDPSNLFENIIEPNPNVEFVVCGHVGAAKKGTGGKPAPGFNDGTLVSDDDIATGHRSDSKSGLTVHQLLFNAQWTRNGGDGWMLLIEFLPDNQTAQVKTFSPHLQLWRTGSEYNYVLGRSHSIRE